MAINVSNPSARGNGNTAAELSKEIVVAYLNNSNNQATGGEVVEMFENIQKSINAMLEGAPAATVSKTSSALADVPATVVSVVKSEAPEQIEEDTASGRTGVHAKFPDIDTAPVVDIKDSIRGDTLVCLIDGAPKKMLKRHLRAKYGMEFHEYREFFGLDEDYPSVAPGYADLKSREAKNQGFGLTVTKTSRVERGLKARKKGSTASAQQKTRATQRAHVAA